MAVTKEDLRRFHRFVEEKITNGAATSLVDLAGEWEADRRETQDTVEAIRQSHVDIDAGRVASVAETFAEVRSRLGKL